MTTNHIPAKQTIPFKKKINFPAGNSRGGVRFARRSF